jgi:hypothetical protein
VAGQLIEQEGVALVAAVVADLLTQQAGGHADQDLAHVAPFPGGPTSANSAARPRDRRREELFALSSAIARWSA